MRRPIPGLAPRFWLAGLHAVLAVALPMGVSAAASPPAPPDVVRLAETPWHVEPDEISVSGAGVEAFFADGGLVESDEGLPMWGVGLLLDGEGVGRLTWQAQNLKGLWTVPRPVEVTWSEGRAHVARLQFDEPMRRARLSRNGATVGFAQLEPLYERRPAGVPLARELPRSTLLEVKAGASSTAAALPPGVVSRAQWGARNTGRCGSAHRPQFLTVHHTATPNNDSFSPAARMRQMQAYHIDTRGWCDFGYHFTVGIDGKVYEGRDPDATGAHVGDWNTNNVGISVVGTFTDTSPRQLQLDALTEISRWVVNRYGIPRTRNNIRGHKEWPGHTSNSCPGRILPWLPTLVARLSPPPPPPP
ncbi:MAG: peptidoglycan recognition protein, partial [Xanthomonadaceae bacterium]|nr:peptidoglycan recognition protein [Xanthomonadaceae bacterium]